MSNATRIIPITVGQYNDTAGMPKSEVGLFAPTMHNLTENVEYGYGYTVHYSDGSKHKGTCEAVDFLTAMHMVAERFADGGVTSIYVVKH